MSSIFLILYVASSFSVLAMDGFSNETQISPPELSSDQNYSIHSDISCQLNEVKKLNATELLGTISADKEQGKNGSIFFANFYSSNCPFSRKLAPHFSELPAAFPSLRFFKFNAAKEPHLNLRFGVFGYPTVFAFKNGMAFKRYDGPYNLSDLERFVQDISFVPAIGKIARRPLPPYVEQDEDEKDLFLYFSILVSAILPVELLCRRIWSRNLQPAR